MNTTEFITIIALIAGPVCAVRIQTYLEDRKEKKQRKLQIFKTLMATRGALLSPSHIESLNRIDLEFYGETKYQKVRDSWKEYFDNLVQKESAESNLHGWMDKNGDLLATLLHEMGKSLEYKFDRVLIKRNIYSPIAYFEAEHENEIIRKGLVDILRSDGEGLFPVSIEHTEIDEEILKKQKEALDLQIQYFKQQLAKNEMLSAKEA
jgi:hypothetical protein